MEENDCQMLIIVRVSRHGVEMIYRMQIHTLFEDGFNLSF